MPVIKGCGSQAKLSWGKSQLCAGLEAGIEGAIHSVHKKINIANALSFPQPSADTSATTTANTNMPPTTHPTKIVVQ